MPAGPIQSLTLFTDTETETTAIARALSPVLDAGDCILLSGEIGAGKSVFARALISTRLASFGKKEDIPSPTFTLVQTYWDGETEIWHADLYRLSSPEGSLELGLDEAFENSICIVEWPDRLGSHVPQDALYVDISVDRATDRRFLELHSLSERWNNSLNSIESAVGVRVAN